MEAFHYLVSPLLCLPSQTCGISPTILSQHLCRHYFTRLLTLLCKTYKLRYLKAMWHHLVACFSLGTQLTKAPRLVDVLMNVTTHKYLKFPVPWLLGLIKWLGLTIYVVLFSQPHFSQTYNSQTWWGPPLTDFLQLPNRQSRGAHNSHDRHGALMLTIVPHVYNFPTSTWLPRMSR